MISGLSSCLVETLLKNDIIENKQAPAYQYGFEIFISTIVTCIITLASGLILNCLSAVLLYFGLFVMLRSVCGGYHAGTYWQCNLTFLLVTIAVLLIYKYTTVEQFSDLHYCSIALSVLITAVYAPVENENKPLSDRQKKLFRKKFLHLTQYVKKPTTQKNLRKNPKIRRNLPNENLKSTHKNTG